MKSLFVFEIRNHMKRVSFLLFVLAGFAFQLHAQGDAISKYFDKYMDDERFSMVYISPKTFDLLSRIELEGEDVDPEIMEAVKDLKGLRILSLEGEGANTFYADAKRIIDNNNYEELIVARDEGENVQISVNSNGDIVNELLLLVGGDDDFVLMSFVGNIDLKKVGKLSRILEMKEARHLDKIDHDKSSDQEKKH